MPTTREFFYFIFLFVYLIVLKKTYGSLVGDMVAVFCECIVVGFVYWFCERVQKLTKNHKSKGLVWDGGLQPGWAQRLYLLIVF
jgi:hypothetical protein